MKTGLILVDIQNDYFPGGKMELVGMKAASANAKELLSLFRHRQWPTFHIQHVAEHEGATFFLPHTEGVELHESIQPLPREMILQKKYPNSFRDTGLSRELKKAGVDQIVVCGAMSHMCIDATARAGADDGFDCTVIQDACATKNLDFNGKTISADQVHGAFMATLGAAYASVLSFNGYASSIAA